MPKKFQGENSKAAAAKARKNVRAAEDAERKQKEEEDEYWRDDDKGVKRKQDRKAERERKKAEQAQHKQELKLLADSEVNDLQEKVGTRKTGASESSNNKVTRAQIAAYQAKVKEEADKKQKSEEDILHGDKPLEENVNRLVDDHITARGLDEAINVLSVSDQAAPIDQHPERRMKAAYAGYEERMLAQLKADNPNMRLSQMKQMVKKEWMKSAENPMNQAIRQRQQLQD